MQILCGANKNKSVINEDKRNKSSSGGHTNKDGGKVMTALPTFYPNKMLECFW